MNLLQNPCTGLAAEAEGTVETEDTADKEVTVEREVQAVNRRTLADDRTVMTMTLMIIRTTAIIAADKTSGMKHIAIAILPEDARILAKKEEEHADLANLANRPTGQHIQDIVRGQVPLKDINSRRPAPIGPTHVPEHQDSHPATTLDLTNRITTSSNATPADNIKHHPITSNIINTHTSTTVLRAKHIISTGNGTLNPGGFNRPTAAGWTCVHSIPGNPYATICLQFRDAIMNYGFMATLSPWDCKLNPCTGENLLRKH